MSLTFRSYIGPEIAQVIAPFARLRIDVFRDWPYLYDGDLAYEERYLHSYAQGDTILVAAFDGAQMVGASTAMPLTDHADDFAAAFQGQPYAFDQVFYCAESVLLPGYRGQRAGHVFFDRREDHARSLGFRYSAFCAVQRPADHPMRPAAYQPLDAFWRKRGYAALPDVVAQFSWRDIGDTAQTEKPLQFWIKQL